MTEHRDTITVPEEVMKEAEHLVGVEGDDPPTALQIARALLSAEARGMERAAKIADSFTWDEHELAQATEFGHALHAQATDIADSIRTEASDA